MKIKRTFVLLCILVFLPARESIQGSDTRPKPLAEDWAFEGQKKDGAAEFTLAGLRRVSDYPLYVMRYRGDHGFSEYLKTGERRSGPRSILPLSDHSAFPWACTCFAALGNPGSSLLGRNFDWFDDIPLVLFTKPDKGYASVSMVDLRYFGFNRKHPPDTAGDQSRLLETPFAPFDGMNEKGVAVGMMAVPRSEPPFDSGKMTIGELHVIRLILDYAASVDEAVELIGQYNVRIEDPPIHYLVADSAGRSVIIEFVNRKMIVLPRSEPWQVSTNFIVDGTRAPRGVSCWRYNRAYRTLQEADGASSIPEALGLLRDVSQENTIWSVVYDLTNGGMHVVPGRRFHEVFKFDLSEMTTDRSDSLSFRSPD